MAPPSPAPPVPLLVPLLLVDVLLLLVDANAVVADAAAVHGGGLERIARTNAPSMDLQKLTQRQLCENRQGERHSELVRNHRRLMEMTGGLYVAGSDELLAEATGTFIPLPDAERNKLVKQLGGDFAAWEQWLANNKMTEP